MLRPERRLSVLAPITARASGQVTAALEAAGRTERFDADVEADQRRVSIDRRIPQARARSGTGTLTLTYGGDGDTQDEEVRLRAASHRADLDASRPRISKGRLVSSGRISRRAKGVVRLQLLYEPPGGQTRTLGFKATIRNGTYRFDEALPDSVLTEIAHAVRCTPTLFTGYFPHRVRGEMRSFPVPGSR